MAAHHPQVVTSYIGNECSLGRLLGPLAPESLPCCHVNRCGVIPKGHNTGKWRLIVDLSFLPGESVNDGIDSAPWHTRR